MKNLLKKIDTKLAVLGATLMVSAASALAQTTTSSWDQFFDAVDFSGVAAKVVAGGLLIVGIAVAFKGPDLAKRLVRKA